MTYTIITVAASVRHLALRGGNQTTPPSYCSIAMAAILRDEPESNQATPYFYKVVAILQRHK
jgi:hypothetical protein